MIHIYVDVPCKSLILFCPFSVSYLNYGPFSSYAPSFDSSFANITKEESDMLMNAYGDETGVQYAKR